MLIEFSVSNFRSFREKQTFSMVASSSRVKKDDNVFKPSLDENFHSLLKVAAIYGPNASGKSNFLKALDVVRQIASRKPSANADMLPISTFRFDQSLANEPSRFELHFIAENMRYEFNLALTKERIVEESLFFYPKGKESLLYKRVNTPEGDKYEFGDLEGDKILRKLWVDATSPQILFISQAVANSSSNLNQLRIPFKWMSSGLIVSAPNLVRSFTNLNLDHKEKFTPLAEGLSTFLNEVDVPIVKIRFDQVKTNHLNDNGLSAKFKTKMVLTHRSALGEAEFSFEEESSGTKNLIDFWTPWFIHQFSNWLDERYTLVVDEFDSSLHPEIVSYLVDKHIKSGYQSQLIFTTHDTHLMDTKLLRRDQYWLTERDKNGATQLRSIHDFKGRESDDIEKQYYEGRYRALPIIRKS